MKMLRKAVLQIGAPALIAFMAWNAYLAVNHLKQMQKTAALTLESSAIQANISAVTTDLTDMETGQRGYLLTEDIPTCSPTPTPKAESQLISPRCAKGWLIARIANGRSNRNWKLWLAPSKRKWNTPSICGSEVIVIAHLCSWLRTKVRNIWIKLAPC